ncbi:MAG: hypothetical protein WC782_13860 [Methylococcaceae bacterium]
MKTYKIWQFMVMLVAVLCAGVNAAPITLHEKINSKVTTKITDLIIVQKETFNDGKYALIENKSEFDKYKSKKVEATCPSGMKAVSAGFSAASGSGEPPGYRLILSKPENNGASWVIYADFDSSGNRLAADFDWELRMTLVCIKL